MTRAASPSRPTRSSRCTCAPRAGRSARLLRGQPGRPPGHHRDLQPDGARQFAATARCVRFARSTGSPSSWATATRTSRPPSAPAWTTFPGRTPDDYPGGDRGAHDAPPRRLPRHASASLACTAGSCASTRATAGRRPAGPDPPRRHRPGPRLSRRTLRPPRYDPRPGRRTRREDRPRLAVRLPAARVASPSMSAPLREPPAARPRRPDHHVARHGLQRSSEGDVIRIGKGFSDADQRLRGHAHGVAPVTSAMSATSSTASASTCSTSTSRSCRSCPLATASRVAERQHRARSTPTAGFVPRVPVRQPRSCAPMRPGSTAGSRSVGRGPPLHRPLLPGRLQGHPQRRGCRAFTSARSPSRAGRTGRANILFVGPPRAPQGPARPAQGLPRSSARPAATPPAPGRLRPAGAGGAPVRGDPAVCGRGVPGPRRRTPTRLQLFRTADVFVSPATGRESFGIVLLEAMAAGAPIVARHPRLQGRGPPRRAGPAGAARESPRQLAAAIGRLLVDPDLRRARFSASGLERARGLQLGRA